MKANAKEVPKEIRALVRQKYNDKPVALKLGTRSPYPGLAQTLYDYSKTLNSTSEYSYLAFEHQNGVSVEKVQRAFGIKTPKTVTKVLRDLLCLYASDGTKDWNKLISELFSGQSEKLEHLLDEDEQNVVEGNAPVRPLTKEDLAEFLREIKKEASQPEFDLIEKVVTSEAKITDDKPEIIRDVLTVPSHKNPFRPEFPPKEFYHPEFPATPTIRIQVPGFDNVWLKDESKNPTGTHKDRMAWEVTLNALRWEIPEISLISSGSAAIAIKFFFNLYDVPTKLKVLVDKHLASDIKKAIADIGCELYETDLSLRQLKSHQIRTLTNNKKGYDITYRETMDAFNIVYYDWASYEILREKPQICLIPFGTGDLYSNVLKIIELEFDASHKGYAHDPRLEGIQIQDVAQINFLAATTKNAASKLDKLFSYFLPTLDDHERFINRLRNKCIGPLSDIYCVDEPFVDEALDIAKTEGISCEPSGIAGLSLLLQEREMIPRDAKILIVNTGNTNYHPVKPPRKDISATQVLA